MPYSPCTASMGTRVNPGETVGQEAHVYHASDRELKYLDPFGLTLPQNNKMGQDLRMAFELGFHTQKCKCPWVHIHVHTQTQYSHLLYVSTALINLYLDCVAVSIVRLGFDFDVLLGTVVSKSGRSLLIFMLGISTPTLLVIQQFTKVLSISHFALRSGQDTTRTLGCCIPDWD